MKKLIIVFMVILSLLWQGASSQNLIAVQNGGMPEFYSTLDSAIVAAQDGDTVYLPGGSFTFETFNIDKRLHIIGAGINPDSSSMTKVTQISGYFHLLSNAEGSILTGFEIDGITFCNTVNNIQVSRCRISSLKLGDSEPSYSTNNVFYGNIIGNIHGYYTQGNTYFNNMIMDCVLRFGSYNLFRNNVFFLRSSGYEFPEYTYFGAISNSFFENNIFLARSGYYSSYSYNVHYCNFRNNIFLENINTWSLCSDCIWNDNIIGQPENSVFVNQFGNQFYFWHDYHLQPTCPGKNAGTDGTDIGVYGGLHPWKDGSLPVNPHVQLKNIYNSTDSTGNLKVNIKVSAQDR